MRAEAPFQPTLARRITALFLIPLVAFAALLLVVRSLDTSATEARRQQIHSERVLRRALLAEKLLLDAETSLRGYLLSGDENLRENYRKAALAVPDAIDMLEKLVADNPSQSALVGAIRREAQIKLDALRATESLAPEHPPAGLVKPLRAGTESMDRLRALVLQFLNQEQLLERERDASARAARRKVRRAIVIGFALTIGVGLGLGALLSRTVTGRLFAVARTAQRLGEGLPAGPPLSGNDEIALVDRSLREFAGSLVEATRRERAVIDNAAEVICTIDSDGRFVGVSPIASRIWRHAPADLVGKRLASFIAPGDIARTVQALAAHSGNVEFESGFVRSDASVATMLWSIRWSEQEQLHFGVALDISDRKKAEMALRESEERYRLMAENTADMISRHSSSGIFLYASPACRTLFGYAPEDLTGRSLFDLYHPEDLASIRSSTPASVEWSAGAFVTARFRRHDGTYSWVEVNSRPVRDPDSGLVREILAVTRDVTKRHRAEESLRQSEARLRSLVDNMLGALITIRPDGIIESVNPSAERMFGYSSRDLVGRHLEILVPPSAGDDPRRFLAAARQRSLGRITQWEGRRRSGDVFPFEIALFQFQTPEGPRIAGNLIDISDRREVERMKNAFVAAVSHELRTPLTSIRGSLGMLSAGAFGPLPAEALDAVSIAERNTLRLIALVNEILDLERLQADRFEIHPGQVAVEDLFSRSIESVAGMAGERSVSVRSEPCPLTIQADADRIVQVLVNLLSNAVKFSPRGETVELRAAAAGDMVEFRVEDRGRGVPPHLREAIFERFRQVEASDSRDHGGTGLGLAIAKGIVESHGGSIGVESAAGRGSIFWFRIPTTSSSVERAREAT